CFSTAPSVGAAGNPCRHVPRGGLALHHDRRGPRRHEAQHQHHQPGRRQPGQCKDAQPAQQLAPSDLVERRSHEVHQQGQGSIRGVVRSPPRPYLVRSLPTRTSIVQSQSHDDVLHRFLLPRAGVRGALVRLGSCWREVAGRADYPPALQACLGEALAASALLTGNIKLDGSLSIELKSSSALRLLFAECSDQGHLRGLARWNEPLPEPLALDELADAVLAITLGNVERGQRYQGLVELRHAGLAESLENYFIQSEQLPARILLAANGEQAVGLMLQKMP